MQDRRRRTALHIPPPTGPVLLTRERQSSTTGSGGPSEGPDSDGSSSGADGSSGSSGASGSGTGSGSSGSSDDNPFAPPPEGRPDQPWRPRHPENGGTSGDGSDSDQGGRGGWGSQWSSRQPGRSSGGFGSRPGSQNSGQHEPGSGQGGPEGGRGGGPRWDPTDPAQRRARYALLSGMWAFFFALFDFPEIALLLGALGVYWAISSLRNKPQRPASGEAGAASTGVTPVPARPAPRTPTPGTATTPNRQQTTAAVSGLVTAVLALVIVAATFSVQIAYRDYYTCLNDSLTKEGQLSCNVLLPDSLRPIFGVKE